MRLRPPALLRAAPALLLLLLQVRLQVSEAMGVFELQIRLARNEKGVLADGRCCRGGREPPCPVAEPCHTFFRVCLKEYQLRAHPGGPCVLGAATTPVLGGNLFSALLQKPLDRAGTVMIPFDFAWPRSYSLVLEARDAANASDVTSPGSGQLIEQVSRSGMVNPGEDWQDLRHPGRSALLEYRLRVHCHEHYYGPSCNLLCRPRDDFFGHHSCDAAGNKVCLDGWTGNKCQRAVCRQGCHKTHGFCEEPGECRCHYGWTGPHCDRCLLFPGCVHGSCTLPWKCDCETNWGGLLCDKDLNYCGSHRPCQNGGTCANKEPDEYECLCLEGFSGRNCEYGMNLCTRRCQNGGTCKVEGSRQTCSCQPGYTGAECETKEGSCQEAPCLHGGQCQQAENRTFFCRCPPGFGGRWCQVSANLCSPNPCPKGAICQDGGGSYTCVCPEDATCQISPEPCLGQGCRGESNAALFSAVLPPALLLAGVVPVLVVVLLLCIQRRSLPRVPGAAEPPANNSLRPDAIHLIRNLTQGEAERGLGETGGTTKVAGLPDGAPPSTSSSKVDISNQERTKLNRLNIGPALARPPL